MSGSGDWPRFFVWPDGRSHWRLVQPDDGPTDCTDMPDREFEAFMERLSLRSCTANRRIDGLLFVDGHAVGAVWKPGEA